MGSDLIETDVLVIGGGYAGCWAAIKAKEIVSKVTLVDKGLISRSGTTLYCHDMLAPTPDNEFDGWLRDAVEHTEYMSDQRFVEIMLKEGGGRIEQLEDWGVPFERNERGELITDKGRGHKVSKVIFFDGRKMMEVLRRQVMERGIKLVERVMVTDLLTSDGQLPTEGRVVGAVGVHTRTGKFIAFQAKAVVICTGLISSKLHFTYADNLTGDGQAMALRAGAEFGGLEFSFDTNFTCIYKGGIAVSGGLIQFQTLGAQIVNSQGERFFERYVPHRKEQRADFGLLAQAMVKEIQEGRGPIYFDMRHFSKDKFARVRRIIPVTMAGLDDANIDPSKELVQCKPIVTEFAASGSGGICINTEGESTIPGLLAAGVAAQCPGCAEFLSGGFIAFCQVFGYRAGERAAMMARKTSKCRIEQSQVENLKSLIFCPLERKDGIRPAAVYRNLNKKMISAEYSIIKTDRTIKEMLNEIRIVATEDLVRVCAKDTHELIKANEARNYVGLLELIYTSVLERKETRLNHYRLDYPYKDDINWLKWVIVKKEKEDVKVRLDSIAVGRNPIKPPPPAKVPAPVQFAGNSP